MISNFEAASKLLNRNHKSTLDSKFNLFFIDYELIPLLIHENYINSYKNNELLEMARCS
jgi:hypothetical protein